MFSKSLILFYVLMVSVRGNVHLFFFFVFVPSQHNEVTVQTTDSGCCEKYLCLVQLGCKMNGCHLTSCKAVSDNFPLPALATSELFLLITLNICVLILPDLSIARYNLSKMTSQFHYLF